MIRPIVRLGDPVLKTPARAVAPGESVEELACDMAETLAASGGVGLAAPQVGESVRLILASSFPSPRNPDRPEVPLLTLVNPAVVAASPETESAWEGCLSFPEYRVRVERPRAVVVEFRHPDGSPGRVEAEGFFARVLLHEIDHLDGVLTLDRVRSPGDVIKDEPDDRPPVGSGHGGDPRRD